MINECIEARMKIIENVRKEMLGPGSEDIGSNIKFEVITDSPIERYSLGVLFPQDNKVEQGIINTTDEESDENINFDGDEKETLFYKAKDDEIIKLAEKKAKEYEDSQEYDEVQEQISMANQLLPSAMGLTFFAKGQVEKLKVRVSCAKYTHTTFRDCCVRLENEFDFNQAGLDEYVLVEKGFVKLKQNLNKLKVFELVSGRSINEERPDVVSILYKLAKQCTTEKPRNTGYKRVPLLEDKLFLIPMVSSFNKVFIGKNGETIDEIGELKITVLKKSYGNDIYSYTVMLVNENEGKKRYNNTIFQPQLKIKTEDNKEFRFIENFKVIKKSSDSTNDEELLFDLLYNNKKNYSIGHGVATNQQVDFKSGEGEIFTDFMPSYEVPQLDFCIKEIEGFSDELLSMFKLSDISDINKENKIELLNKFEKAYFNWINELIQGLDTIEPIYKKVANQQIDKCNYALKRIKSGIKILSEDNKVFTAFSLMNRAMIMQRAHSKVEDRFPNDVDIEFPKFDYKNIEIKRASWRPFQLAFILMNIESISRPYCKERDIVDLIWVPTGGGKTEAYLGLSGLTIFLRRLNDPKRGGGTTIIMRYTLRLLAAQQFIRASILICACELMRKEGKYDLGKDEISIGLWVGSSPTPNTNKVAKEEFSKLTKTPTSEYDLNNIKIKHNKFQVLRCPWCGTKLEIEYRDGKKIGQWGYDYDKKKILFCPEGECDFTKKLPIQVVDEELYKNPPTLLFGTVDKFASIAWKADAGRLFALNKDNDNKQPELIIQDELHLISGPLGTIVGLYETAIDAMCSSKGVKPKIIASTATIRRATEQCKMLFNREVFQFPPSGLKIEDSFFTREHSILKEPGRMYVGLMPSGKTSTTTQVRLYTVLLQGINLIEATDKILDKYWTLVGYFNTIRELGKSSTLVIDDVSSNNSRFMKRLLKSNNTRYTDFARELTSRLETTEINKTLKDLDNKYSKESPKKAINVLLATNMISVGVDVPRLNLMVVSGQPKQTAEYIQATSRVGREYPGVVFTLYNGSKTRDRSHYELFYPYHQTFYKYVEPTSVTPYSEQARERALHAVFITLMRHVFGLNKEEQAKDFSENLEGLDEIKKIILDRAKSLDNSTLKDITKETEKELEEIISKWHNKVYSLSGNEVLCYNKKGADKNLIVPYLEGDGSAFGTMQSMRNVDFDASVDIIEFGGEMNE